jgi:DNA-binding transcriptional LysR family regulator
MAELVEAGMGYTTLTEEVAMRHLKDKKLIILNPENKFKIQPVLAWYPRPEMPNYFSDLIKQIK